MKEFSCFWGVDSLRSITWTSILVRMTFALIIGGVLGIERGTKNRPAGFRTYMLVCLGAAMVMMTNQYVYQSFGASDPVRMGAQVISGIGFLGAGTIVLNGKNRVRGITTAAGLWTAACCGLAIGIGFYEAAIAGGLSVLLIMSWFQRLDSALKRRSKIMPVYMEVDGSFSFGDVIAYARNNNIEFEDIQIQKNEYTSGNHISAILAAHIPKKNMHGEMIHVLSEAPGVIYIEELQ